MMATSQMKNDEDGEPHEQHDRDHRHLVMLRVVEQPHRDLPRAPPDQPEPRRPQRRRHAHPRRVGPEWNPGGPAGDGEREPQSVSEPYRERRSPRVTAN